MQINFPIINTSSYKKINYSKKEIDNVQNHNKKVDVLEYLSGCALSFQGRQPIPVYAIFKDGSYQKFNSKYHASVKLGINAGDISRETRRENKNKRNIILVEARKVEKKQADGTIIVDKTEIQKQLQKFKSAIYAISPDGEFIKFETRKEAAETLKVDAPSITHCLQGKAKTVKGYAFVYAKDIEKKDELGNVYVPKETIDLLLTFTKKENAIYSILPDGTYKKFNSQAEAQRFYKLFDNAVHKCVNEELKTVQGMTFVRASEIEKCNAGGEKQVDEKKLEKYLKRFKSPIYAVDEKGNYIKFATRKEAAETLHIDGPSISACLSGKTNRAGNYTFVRADEIEEKDEKGEIIIPKAKIREILMNFKTAIYAVDNKGNYILFKSRKEAEETLHIDGPSITHCLKGKAKTAGGYHFFRANEIDANENIEEQIKAKLEKLLEEQRNSEVIAIFPDKTTKEYANARVAAKELKLDPSAIYKTLKGENKTTKGIAFIRKKENNAKE